MTQSSLGFCRVDDQWVHRGIRTIVLENAQIRVDVLPDLGGRINRFEHRASGYDLLWHNARVETRPVPIGANYDDNFAGGWDELFPNDLAGKVEGEEYPDHGELWCQPWSYRIESSADEVSVVLHRYGAVTTSLVEKRIALRAGESQIRLSHRITNVGATGFSFLFKMHPALAIDEGDKIDVPGTEGEVVDPTFGRVSSPKNFAWPIAVDRRGNSTDLSTVPALDGTRDFVYVSGLDGGWCALRRLQLGIGFGLVFPEDIFRSVWLFMSFGGWRGHRTVVLEPCTSMPKDLNEAIRCGTAQHLGPGESLAWESRAIAFEGCDELAGFDASGRPVRQAR